MHLKKNVITLSYEKNQNELSRLMKDYGSDKGSPIDDDISASGYKAHLYTDIYFMLFNAIRYSVMNILEIGIGSNNPEVPSNMGDSGKPGASLRGFRDFFPNSRVFGADIDSRILFEEERIKTFYVDQTNPDSILQMLHKIGIENFDIIIDDGLHTAEAAITLLECSFSKLKEGGFYLIEDVAGFENILEAHLQEKGYRHYFIDFSNGFSHLFIILK